MIDINYDDDTNIIRANIGDPKKQFVSDDTINSALTKYDGDIIQASILIMETMLAWFSTLADESKTDAVEYKYNTLYNRYKAKLQEFKIENSKSANIPIIFGGTTLSSKNIVADDEDGFNMFMQEDWLTLKLNQSLYEI